MAKTQQQILKDFGRSGWSVAATRPETTTVMVDDPSSPTGTKPYEQPTGNIIWGIVSPTGQYDEVTVTPSEIKSGDVWTTEPVYEPVKGPKEEIKVPEGSTEAQSPQLAAQRQAEAAAAQALAQQRQAEQAQRDKNEKATGFGLTDNELARLRSDAASQGLTEQQIALRAREIEQQGRQADRQHEIAAANNAIAAANNALAAKRLELDEIVRQDASKLDWAKFEYLKFKDAADQAIAQNKLDLDRLQQLQTSELAQGQLAVSRETLEQRRAEAAQTAQTAAMQQLGQAAQTSLQGIQAGAQTGAGLLQNRVAQATGLIQNLGALPLQGKSPMLNIPSEAAVRGMVSGVGGWATELGGGPEVYQAAANLVQRADPGSRLGANAQQVYAAMADATAKFQAMTGRMPAVAQVANQPMPKGGYTSPVTNGSVTPIPNPNAPPPPPGMPRRIVQPKRPQAMAGLGSVGGGAWNPDLITAGMNQQAASRGFTVPSAPTIQINVAPQ